MKHLSVEEIMRLYESNQKLGILLNTNGWEEITSDSYVVKLKVAYIYMLKLLKDLEVDIPSRLHALFNYSSIYETQKEPELSDSEKFGKMIDNQYDYMNEYEEAIDTLSALVYSECDWQMIDCDVWSICHLILNEQGLEGSFGNMPAEVVNINTEQITKAIRSVIPADILPLIEEPLTGAVHEMLADYLAVNQYVVYKNRKIAYYTKLVEENPLFKGTWHERLVSRILNNDELFPLEYINWDIMIEPQLHEDNYLMSTMFYECPDESSYLDATFMRMDRMINAIIIEQVINQAFMEMGAIV